MNKITSKQLLYILFPIFMVLFGIVTYLTRPTSNTSNCVDSIIYKHDTIYQEKKVTGLFVDGKPIPSITKYKVSDLVCIWGKWSGVVTQVEWSETDDRVLVYFVTIYREDGDFDEGSYYDTELEFGKCN